jgi:prepilin-type N-terminal cleavage/methylation domain-containing protein
MVARLKMTGFTIVELLIVIVVIAILAAITIVAYNGIQTRSQNAKISADLALLNRAIQSARVNSNEIALRYVTSSAGTAGTCMYKAPGTDLATLDKATDTCWTQYLTSMQRISDASGVNVRGLVDPWGRPYALDENEKEGATQCGTGKDVIGIFSRPLNGVSWIITNTVQVPYITPGCS